jgi:hypothetical protein
LKNEDCKIDAKSMVNLRKRDVCLLSRSAFMEQDENMKDFTVQILSGFFFVITEASPKFDMLNFSMNGG